MKMTHQFFLICFLLTVQSLSGQTSTAINNYDRSFTLTKRLHQDKLGIAQHGVSFKEKKKQVLKDFSMLESLSVVDLSRYQKKIVVDGPHLIKIWTAKTPLENISTIIEINSVYVIDTTKNNKRIKNTIVYNDYFLQLKDATKAVYYQTINKQGVSSYSIGKRRVSALRETVLTGLLYVDNTGEIKKLLKKYNLK